MGKANRKLLTIIHPDLTSVCETIVEFDKLFEGREGTRGLIHQASPELRAPFTTGFIPWAGDIVMFARSCTTEDWSYGTPFVWSTACPVMASARLVSFASLAAAEATRG
jgi:hypothetical protein